MMPYIWMIVDRLTKSAHFLPYNVTQSLEELAKLYITEIVRLHGIHISIISDRDARLTSRFWKILQTEFGSQLRFSTTFHPQTDGQSERTIQTLEDMLRACVLDFQGSWEDHLPLVEFSYNNSYHSSIGIAPYEALYGRPYRSPICWEQDGNHENMGPELVRDTVKQIEMIRKRLLTAQSRQKSCADRRRKELSFEVGDHVFLKISPTKGVVRFGIKGKLSPRFVELFEILERVGKVAYRLALPPKLNRVHNVFYISMLRKYIPYQSHIIRHDNIEIEEELSFEEPPLRIIEKKEHRLRRKVISMVKVQWKHHKESEATWEPEDKIRELYPDILDKSQE